LDQTGAAGLSSLSQVPTMSVSWWLCMQILVLSAVRSTDLCSALAAAHADGAERRGDPVTVSAAGQQEVQQQPRFERGEESGADQALA
jgi:hypothetical protein